MEGKSQEGLRDAWQSGMTSDGKHQCLDPCCPATRSPAKGRRGTFQRSRRCGRGLECKVRCALCAPLCHGSANCLQRPGYEPDGGSTIATGLSCPSGPSERTVGLRDRLVRRGQAHHRHRVERTAHRTQRAPGATRRTWSVEHLAPAPGTQNLQHAAHAAGIRPRTSRSRCCCRSISCAGPCVGRSWGRRKPGGVSVMACAVSRSLHDVGLRLEPFHGPVHAQRSPGRTADRRAAPRYRPAPGSMRCLQKNQPWARHCSTPSYDLGARGVEPVEADAFPEFADLGIALAASMSRPPTVSAAACRWAAGTRCGRRDWIR